MPVLTKTKASNPPQPAPTAPPCVKEVAPAPVRDAPIASSPTAKKPDTLRSDRVALMVWLACALLLACMLLGDLIASVFRSVMP